MNAVEQTRTLAHDRGATRGRPVRAASQRRAAVRLAPIASVTGVLLVALAIFMLPPLLVDLAASHEDWQVFFASAAITGFVGVALTIAARGHGAVELGAREAFLLTSVVWLTMTGFAALPLGLSELDLTLADAVFEATSGLTTTGSTVVTGLDTAPPGILLWRAILQWLGGIGIIVMGVAILPILKIGGMQLFRTESSDSSDKIVPRARQLAAAISMVYLSLTLACGALYWLAGMNGFEAIAHAMTTIATGGFSTSDYSIGVFRNPWIEWTAIVFMFVGGVPFVLFIRAIHGQRGSLARDVQLRWYALIALAAAATLAFWLWRDGQPIPSALRQGFFAALTVMTGTGYATADYSAWGAFPLILAFFLMCVGGCTGSTTGGIKIFRFVVLASVAKSQLVRLVQPHRVIRATFNERRLSDDAAMSVMAFFVLFAATFTAVAVVLGAFGLGYLEAMSASLTALANVGPALGEQLGPSGHFQDLPEGAKWTLSIAMMLGRLEIFTLFILLTPLFWRG